MRFPLKTILFVLALLLQLAHAVPERSLTKSGRNQIFSHFSQGHQGTFINPQGMKLNYHSFLRSDNSKTIVILPGRSEPAVKYAEVIFDLKDHGYNIFILDHQGQGSSERLLEDKQKGHVRAFTDYVQDFSNWMDEVVVPVTKDQERFLLAHSMGGGISVHYLAREKQLFKKVILSAPMMELNTKPYSETVARLLSRALVLGFKGASYAPDRGPYVAAADTFEKNEVTHSRIRFEMGKALFVLNPELVVGGPTNKWVNQSLTATKKIDFLATKIKTPILMLQSGLDLIVKNDRQNSFCKKSLNCKKIHFAQAHHEILMESDDVRDVALSAIKSFLKN